MDKIEEANNKLLRLKCSLEDVVKANQTFINDYKEYVGDKLKSNGDMREFLMRFILNAIYASPITAKAILDRFNDNTACTLVSKLCEGLIAKVDEDDEEE